MGPVRRLAPLVCSAAVAIVVASAAAPALAQERPSARLVRCTTGATPAARTATFTARMPAANRTMRMWMRFDLLQRMSDEAEFAPVALPAWGVWERSERGRPAFIFTKKVRALRAPGAYRARVRFRWYDARGRIQRRAQRVTQTCRQPDPRPNLRAGGLSVATGLGPASATYMLTVTNPGRGAAGPFDVVLSAGAMPEPPVRVAGLPAGGSVVVALPGPRCAAGATLRFVLDSGAAVAESDEADDVVDRACPV
jgi:hypothetical protein